MPAWKKVIVSGSDAKLNSLLVTQSVTASVGDFTTELTASGLHYPTADGGADYVLTTDGNGKLTFEYIRTIYETVKNVGTQSLAKGTPVYTVDTTGNTFNVDLADAIDAGKMPASFILAQALAPDEEGLGIILGFINGVNTSQFGEGDVVFVAPGGGYTNVQPTGSALIQPLGQVLKVDASNGSGVVFNPGVTTGLPNIEPGKLWVGNSDGVPTAIFTSSLYSGSYSGSFKGNGSQLTGVTVPFTSITSKPTLVSGSSQITYSQIAGVPTTLISSSTGTDNYIPRFLNGKALENSLIYDNGTNVGIRTTSPSYNLDVNGTGRFGSNLVITGSVSINSTEAITIPVGTISQRPGTPQSGMVRYNTETTFIEYYNGITWISLTGATDINTEGGTLSSIVSGSVSYLVHTFTTSGTFTVSNSSKTVRYFIIGGGGGGGGSTTYGSAFAGGGGGGAGGVISGTVTLSPGSYSIVIGGGGARGNLSTTQYGGSQGGNGTSTSALGLTAVGGGGGGASTAATANNAGLSGGSGGGAGLRAYNTLTSGGSGTSGQGNAGGNAGANSGAAGGGGGGGVRTAGQAAPFASPASAASGARGLGALFLNSSGYYAAGGYGGGTVSGSYVTGNSPANTGNGGPGSYAGGNNGGAGGSGVVLIYYPI